MPDQDENARRQLGNLKASVGLRFKTYATLTSAISSVDMVATLVVASPQEAQAIKIEVVKQEIHDLTAVSEGNFPDHVTIPDDEKARALARSYAGAELIDRGNKSAWYKSWIGWAVTVAVALLSLYAGSFL